MISWDTPGNVDFYLQTLLLTVAKVLDFIIMYSQIFMETTIQICIGKN